MSIRKLKSGKWQAQIGSGKLGTRTTKSFTKKIDATKWLREQQIARETSSFKAVQNIELNINDALCKFIESKSEITTKHKNDLRLSINQICKHQKIFKIKDIKPELIERFKSSTHLSSNKTHIIKGIISRRTHQKKLKHFKAFCEWLRINGWLIDNPIRDVQNIKYTKRKRRALDLEEVKKLLKHVKLKSPNIWYPIIYTALNTGLRKSELATLEWTDIDFERNLIHIRNKPHIKINGRPHKCKWGSTRILPLKSNLRQLFNNLKESSECNLIFHTKAKKLKWNNWGKDLSRSIKGVKLRNPDEITTHVFRHTFISQLLAYGKQDIKTVGYLAGHKELSTTQEYVHLLGGNQLISEAIESLPDY